MSRNSKNRRNLELARSFSATRKSGGKGPARTEKKHTKRNTFWSNGRTAVKGNASKFES